MQNDDEAWKHGMKQKEDGGIKEMKVSLGQ